MPVIVSSALAAADPTPRYIKHGANSVYALRDADGRRTGLHGIFAAHKNALAYARGMGLGAAQVVKQADGFVVDPSRV